MSIFLLVLRITGLLISGAFTGFMVTAALFYFTVYKLAKVDKDLLKNPKVFNGFLAISILLGIVFFGLYMGAY